MYYDRPKRKTSKPDTRPVSDIAPSAPDPREARRMRRIEEKRLRRRNKREKRAQSPTPQTSAPAQPPRKNKHGLLKLIVSVVLMILAASAAMYLLPVSLFGAHNTDAYGAKDRLPGGYTHVLLIGVDSDYNATSRSDTMLIASVGKSAVKLTTLMRDTGVTIPGYEGTHRLNAAYAYGGAALLLRTVNENFNMDITRYALVSYDTFPALIDALGGVVIDYTEAEMGEINLNLKEELYRQYKTGQMSYDNAYAKYLAEILTEFGKGRRIDGLQAMSFARIRHLDSDYGRTSRQRAVLSAMLTALKGTASSNPIKLIRFVTGAVSSVDTNLNMAEIVSAGLKVLSAGGIAQLRLPANGTYQDDGGMFHDVDYAANREQFIRFVYDS